MFEKPSEQALEATLARAAEGDGDAWRFLVNAYSKRVFALLLGHCSDRDLADEVTQATFVKLVEHIGKYNERGKFESWLFRIAMNNLRDEMRRRKRHARPVDMTGSSGDDGEKESAWTVMESKIVSRNAGGVGASSSSGDDEEPFEQVSRAEQVVLLQKAIATLSEADQKILTLRHTAGLSFAQIAATLGQPLGTVLARGYRALEKLKVLMMESGGEA